MLSIFEKRCHVNVFAVRFMLFPSTLGRFFCCEVHFVAMLFSQEISKSHLFRFNLYIVFIYLKFIIQCSFNFFWEVCSRVLKGFRIKEFDGYIMLFVFYFI